METKELILGLLRRALFSVSFVFDAEVVDWDAVYKEARAQTVDLLIFDALTEQERSAIPMELFAAWQLAAFRRLQFNEQLRYEQAQILEAMRQVAIPCAILKGETCAQNYPNPSLRCAGDIDLLVGEAGLAPAKALLEQLGYCEDAEPRHNHIHMNKGHFTVELHIEPAGIPAGVMGERMRQRYRESLTHADWSHGAPQLPLPEHALVLILHKLGHITANGIGLRQVCDWALFVHRQLKEAVWHDLEPMLKEFGLLRFTKLITRACVEELGLPAENAPWCMTADKQVAQQLLEDILQAGNFGTKENRYGQRLFTDGNSGNRLVSLFRVGVRTCRSHWPVCDRYPILLRVAPFVLVARYRRKRSTGKKPEFKPLQAYQGAKERQQLYAELKPFIREE